MCRGATSHKARPLALPAGNAPQPARGRISRARRESSLRSPDLGHGNCVNADGVFPLPAYGERGRVRGMFLTPALSPESGRVEAVHAIDPTSRSPMPGTAGSARRAAKKSAVGGRRGRRTATDATSAGGRRRGPNSVRIGMRRNAPHLPSPRTHPPRRTRVADRYGIAAAILNLTTPWPPRPRCYRFPPFRSPRTVPSSLPRTRRRFGVGPYALAFGQSPAQASRVPTNVMA
jgi:hypothetical protein